MAAVESHRKRSLLQQLAEGDHVSSIIRQDEGRHRLADVWRSCPGAMSAQSLHQPIDRCCEIRRSFSGGLCKFAQLLTQRRIQVPRPLESLVEAFSADIGSHPGAPAHCCQKKSATRRKSLRLRPYQIVPTRYI